MKITATTYLIIILSLSLLGCRSKKELTQIEELKESTSDLFLLERKLDTAITLPHAEVSLSLLSSRQSNLDTSFTKVNKQARVVATIQKGSVVSVDCFCDSLQQTVQVLERQLKQKKIAQFKTVIRQEKIKEYSVKWYYKLSLYIALFSLLYFILKILIKFKVF